MGELDVFFFFFFFFVMGLYQMFSACLRLFLFDDVVPFLLHTILVALLQLGCSSCC